MKSRYAILTSLFALVLVGLTACQTASTGGGGGGATPPPPGSANCAAPAVLPASFDTPTTLKAGCYAPAGDVDVNAALTLDAGVTIIMPTGAYFDVGYNSTPGSLVALGTATNPVVFQGASSNPGSWVGIEFYSKSSTAAPNELNNTTVRDGGQNPDSGNVSLYGASVTITNSKFFNSLNYGVTADGSSTLPGFSTNQIYGNTQGAMEIPAQDMSQLDVATVYKGNTNDRVTVNGTVDNGSNNMVHWPGIDVPFYANGDIDINSPVTVDAGFDMQVEPGQGIWIDVGYGSTPGSLFANGTVSNPVVFESTTHSQDDWVGIEYYSKSTTSAPNALSFATVRDGGNYGADTGTVSLYGASVAISNSKILNGSNYGITADSSSTLPGFSSNQISGNKHGAMEIPAEDMSQLDVATTYNGNGTDRVTVQGTVDNGSNNMVQWPGIDVPFYANGDIDINSPVTVDAGFVMQVGSGNYVDVGYGSTPGSLFANGTVSSPVVFEGAGNAPGPGYWVGLEFYSPTSNTAPNELNYTTVMDGGGNTADVCVDAGAGVTVTNSRLGDSSGAAISVNPADQSFTQSGNTFVSPYSSQVDTNGGC